MWPRLLPGYPRLSRQTTTNTRRACAAHQTLTITPNPSTIQVKHRKRVLTALNAPGDTILAHSAKTRQKRVQHPQRRRYPGAPCKQQSAHPAAQPRRINTAPLRLGVSASRVTGRTRILHPPLARLQQIREHVTGSHNTITHSTQHGVRENPILPEPFLAAQNDTP